MTRIALKGLWAHKRRLVGTFLAVVLGTSFLAGTLVYGQTLESSFDGLFAEANAGTDVVVRAEDVVAVSSEGPSDSAGTTVASSLADDIRAIDGVAAAEPQVEGFGHLIGADGQPIGSQGPPKIAGNWIEDPDLNPFRLVAGRAPAADDEIVINRGAATAGGLGVGDAATVETPEPVDVTIVGIATFGTEDGIGGSTFAAFTLEGAERHVTGVPGAASSILVEAEPGVSQTELRARIEAVLPGGVEALTGASYTQENVQDIGDDFLDIFRTFLVVFAGIALLVAAFSINNTFSILVAQRTRESALLRAVGATRRQVLASLAIEALLVGVLASATGLLVGVGVAALLQALFRSFGFALPIGGLAFEPSIAVTTIAVGVSVTFVAAVAPAIRASRVRPLAALRDVAVDRSARSRLRAVVGVVLVLAGGGTIVGNAFAGGGLPVAGLAAVATTIGLVVAGPIVARPLSAAIGSAVAGTRGLTGHLARRNAVRNPRRTAATASALMIGVAVVSLFAVFISSVRSSIGESVSRSFAGDVVVSASSFDGGLSPELATDIGALAEVERAVGIGSGVVRIAGEGRDVTVADPAELSHVAELAVVEGSLDDAGLAVSAAVAEEEGWTLGERVEVAYVDGATEKLAIATIYEWTDLVGSIVIPRASWSPHATQAADVAIGVVLAPGVGLRDGLRAVEDAAAAYRSAEVRDRAGYVESVSAELDAVLGLVNAMLALAIVIASMGIANTLSLSVHERTRELGLLRAVGGSRGQVRSMVRWESVIVAVIGTLGGLALGVFLGWGLVETSGLGELDAFSVPLSQLAIVLIGGALVGLIAGLRPARRAARLDVMAAIATE